MENKKQEVVSTNNTKAKRKFEQVDKSIRSNLGNAYW
jgi:hypothetical protein